MPRRKKDEVNGTPAPDVTQKDINDDLLPGGVPKLPDGTVDEGAEMSDEDVRALGAVDTESAHHNRVFGRGHCASSFRREACSIRRERSAHQVRGDRSCFRVRASHDLRDASRPSAADCSSPDRSDLRQERPAALRGDHGDSSAEPRDDLRHSCSRRRHRTWTAFSRNARHARDGTSTDAGDGDAVDAAAAALRVPAAAGIRSSSWLRPSAGVPTAALRIPATRSGTVAADTSTSACSPSSWPNRFRSSLSTNLRSNSRLLSRSTLRRRRRPPIRRSGHERVARNDVRTCAAAGARHGESEAAAGAAGAERSDEGGCMDR